MIREVITRLVYTFDVFVSTCLPQNKVHRTITVLFLFSLIKPIVFILYGMRTMLIRRLSKKWTEEIKKILLGRPIWSSNECFESNLNVDRPKHKHTEYQYKRINSTSTYRFTTSSFTSVFQERSVPIMNIKIWLELQLWLHFLTLWS